MLNLDRACRGPYPLRCHFVLSQLSLTSFEFFSRPSFALTHWTSCWPSSSWFFLGWLMPREYPRPEPASHWSLQGIYPENSCRVMWTLKVSKCSRECLDHHISPSMVLKTLGAVGRPSLPHYRASPCWWAASRLMMRLPSFFSSPYTYLRGHITCGSFFSFFFAGVYLVCTPQLYMLISSWPRLILYLSILPP